MFAAGIAVTLAGCGTASTPTSTGGESATEATTSAAADASLLPAAEGVTRYPLELTTQWGTTTLTERPARIAAVTGSQDDAQALAAIGVTPALASEYTTDVWLEQALGEPIPDRFVMNDGTLPFEQIAAADPDLIIALGDLTDTYDRLSSIAPVLDSGESASEQTRATDWPDLLARLGQTLDLSQAAQTALDAEEEFFATFRSDHPELQGRTLSYVVYYGEEGGLQYHSSQGSAVARVFEQMGFAVPAGASGLQYRQEISQELISAIDADVILFSDNSDGHAATVTDQPLFQALPAVQDGRLVHIVNNATSDGRQSFTIDGQEYEGNVPWALARSGPLSGVWAAEQLAPHIVSAAQG
nr:ABC transporter substrate-binding protein [Propioniciclava soli]